MRLADFRTRIERDLEFPTDRGTVIHSLGGLEIDSPDGDSESVEEILGRTDDAEFRSPEDVYAGVIGCVSDAHIGRKYYDDRGHNVSVEQESF